MSDIGQYTYSEKQKQQQKQEQNKEDKHKDNVKKMQPPMTDSKKPQDAGAASPVDAANVTNRRTWKWNLLNKEPEIKVEQTYDNEYVHKNDIEYLKEHAGEGVEIKEDYTLLERYQKTDYTQYDDDINKMKRYAEKYKDKEKDFGVIITMIQGLSGYAVSKINKNDTKENIRIHSNIIMSMLGNISKTMKKICSGMDGLEKAALEASVKKYEIASKRIGNVANDSLNDDEMKTWNDIIVKSFTEKVIDLSENASVLGDGMSEVLKIKDGDKNKYFKEDATAKRNEISDSAKIAVNKHATKEDAQVLITINLEGIYTACERYYENQGKIGAFYNYLDENAAYEYCRKSLQPRQQELLDKYAFDIFRDIRRHEVMKSFADGMAIDDNESLTARNIATKIIADLMGVSELFVASEKVTVKTSTKENHGFVMEEAKGTSYSDIPERMRDSKASYTGAFQRDMLMLQIFDNIIGQYDRHLNNMFYDRDFVGVVIGYTGVMAIDDDMCMGMSTDMYDNMIAAKIGCLTADNDMLRFECMDKIMYEHMKSLYGDGSCEVIKMNLEGLVADKYIDAAIERFKTLMKAIENTKEAVEKKGGKFLYGKDEWGADTINKMITIKSDDNGDDVKREEYNTYLDVFVHNRALEGKLVFELDKRS